MSSESAPINFRDCPESTRIAEIYKEHSQDSVGYRIAKRLFDLIVASLAILVFSPMMFLVAVLIYLHDRGPVFYRQVRVGRFGKQFQFVKFRSMHVNADKMRAKLLAQSDAQGAAFKMKQDPRITPIGRVIRKLSIDEMPQLFCVLTGEMSVIGPRPHLPAEVATYTEEQHVRLAARPGLLCLREIRGRSNLTFEQWMALDLEYVDNRSIILDFKILLGAIPAVLKGDGAY